MIVRSDLSRGVLAAQTGHAAAEAVGSPPTVMVVLGVDNEAELRRIAAALGEHSLTHRLIVEDAGPHKGEAMAIGLAPTDDRVRQLRELQLLKEATEP